MATQLKYPVYIELYSKTSSFLGSMDKALGAILGLSKGYNDLVKKAKDFERAGKLGAAGSSQLKAVETSALAARKAIVQLAAGFALFKVGEMALKQTVTDLKEAAKFQTQIHNLQGLGEAPGKVAGAKRFAERTAFTLPGAGQAQTMQGLTESRTYVGSLAEAEKIFPLIQRAAFVWASRTGGDMGEGRDFAESLVRGAEPLMRSSQYGTKAYRKRLSWLMSEEEKASALTGVNYADLIRHIATHSGGVATTWTKGSIETIFGLLRASGNRVGSLAQALGQVSKFGAGGFPHRMTPLMEKLGLLKLGKYAYGGALAGHPLQLKGSKEAITNPLGWLQQVVVPRIQAMMKKEGFHSKSLRGTTEFIQHLGFQHNMATALSVMIARHAQIANFTQKLAQVPGLTKQAAIAQATLNGQLLVFHARLKSLETVLGMPLIHLATKALSGFVDILTDLGKLLSKHAALAKGLADLIAAFGPLGIVLGIEFVWNAFKRLTTILPELSANIDALSATMKELSANATVAAGADADAAAATAGAGALGGVKAAGAAEVAGGSVLGYLSGILEVLTAAYAIWSLWKDVVHPGTKDLLRLGGIDLNQAKLPTMTAKAAHQWTLKNDALIKATHLATHHPLKEALKEFKSKTATSTGLSDVIGQALPGLTPSSEAGGGNIIVHGDIHVNANTPKQLVSHIRKHLAGATTAGGGPTARILTGGH